jgi:hypothetical protein
VVLPMKDEIRHVVMQADASYEERFEGYSAAGHVWTSPVPEGVDLIRIEEVRLATPASTAGEALLRIVGRERPGYAMVQADLGQPWQGTPLCMVMLIVELVA